MEQLYAAGATGRAHIYIDAVKLVLAQAAAGLGLAHFGFQPTLQVLHLWMGTLLLGALTVLGLLVHRLDPRAR